MVLVLVVALFQFAHGWWNWMSYERVMKLYQPFRLTPSSQCREVPKMHEKVDPRMSGGVKAVLQAGEMLGHAWGRDKRGQRRSAVELGGHPSIVGTEMPVTSVTMWLWDQ